MLWPRNNKSKKSVIPMEMRYKNIQKSVNSVRWRSVLFSQ